MEVKIGGQKYLFSIWMPPNLLNKKYSIQSGQDSFSNLKIFTSCQFVNPSATSSLSISSESPDIEAIDFWFVKSLAALLTYSMLGQI